MQKSAVNLFVKDGNNMDKNYTHITIVLDRSGSMGSIKADAEGGLNEFIKQQQRQPGRATFTLLQFDHEFEFVYNGAPLQTVSDVKLEPRGCTALLDAQGKAINATGEFLKAMPEHERPGLVVFVTLTDGAENASREFTLQKICEMIEHQREVYKWQFTYLGANQDAIQVAGSMGIPAAAAINYTPRTARQAYTVASRTVGSMRSSVASDQPVENAYTAEERDSLSAE